MTEQKEQRALPTLHQSAFFSIQAFEDAQRMANALARSDLVPQQFRNNLANCIIALEMSQRIGASPLAVMQNLNIIHGRPSWGAQFVIAALNSCGLFSPLRFKVEGSGATLTCQAYAVELASGETLMGPTVSMQMAEREGWLADKRTRDGGTMVSKWKTMPDVMIRYRAATYFGRLYAPHVLMGMRETSELIDVSDEPLPERVVAGDAVVDTTDSGKPPATEALNEQIKAERKRSRKRSGNADAAPAAEQAPAETAPPADDAPPAEGSEAPQGEPPAGPAEQPSDFF